MADFLGKDREVWALPVGIEGLHRMMGLELRVSGFEFNLASAEVNRIDRNAGRKKLERQPLPERFYKSKEEQAETETAEPETSDEAAGSNDPAEDADVVEEPEETSKDTDGDA